MKEMQIRDSSKPSPAALLD